MKLTKEQLERAAACKTADELIALAKAENIELTKEDAEKYLAQLHGSALSLDEIGQVAGGCLTNVCGADVSAVC